MEVSFYPDRFVRSSAGLTGVCFYKNFKKIIITKNGIIFVYRVKKRFLSQYILYGRIFFNEKEFSQLLNWVKENNKNIILNYS